MWLFHKVGRKAGGARCPARFGVVSAFILPMLTVPCPRHALGCLTAPGRSTESRPGQIARPTAIPHALLLVVRSEIAIVGFASDWSLSGVGTEAGKECARALDIFARTPQAEVSRIIRPSNTALAARFGLDRCFVLSVGPGTNPDQLARELGELDLVFESVEPLGIGSAEAIDGTDAGEVGLLPSDPLFGLQYALENVGQEVWGMTGTPDADIDASLAWGISTGSPSVVVAVIDSGISLSHPDLTDQLVHGYNFTSANTADVDDQYYGHGTMIAGIIGGLLNNRVGVAGLAPGCRLMPIRVIDRFGFTAEEWVAGGIIYATDHGASVLNISIGFESASTLLHSAVQYAYESGVVICASSGNIATDPIGFPARYDEAIAVGATDNQDHIAGFTSSGPHMTVAAPGRNIYSTWDTNDDPDTYARLSGTSFAVPYVVGTAALIRSVNPGLSPEQVRSVLVRTADDVGPPGWDQGSGAGRINAYAALTLARTLPGAADPFCRADLNEDGAVDFTDLQYFLTAFVTGSDEADLNTDGMLDFYDIQTFLIDFSRGCSRTHAEP